MAAADARKGGLWRVERSRARAERSLAAAGPVIMSERNRDPAGKKS